MRSFLRPEMFFHNYSSGDEDRMLISHEESMQIKFNTATLRDVYR